MRNTIEKALQKQREKERELANSETHSDDGNQTVSAQPSEEIQRTHETFNTVSTATSSNLDPFNIDLQRLSENGHIALLGERKQINEEYREIKRKLLANAFGALSKTLNNPNIIMVTSSRPSEGKTFTATNLALSIASEQDKTVLLVDADVLKSNVLNTLGLEQRKGLMEYLTGDVDDISEVLYPTNIEKLKIIPSGKSHHLST